LYWVFRSTLNGRPIFLQIIAYTVQQLDPLLRLYICKLSFKTKTIMENQELLNAIAVLSTAIDALNRAGKEAAITALAEKMLELVAKLK
jgi:hypothetical protein